MFLLVLLMPCVHVTNSALGSEQNWLFAYNTFNCCFRINNLLYISNTYISYYISLISSWHSLSTECQELNMATFRASNKNYSSFVWNADHSACDFSIDHIS